MKAIDKCRVCGGSLDPILSLGELFVSDFLLPDDPEGTKAPLDLVLCQSCWLLQLKHNVSADTLYRNYWYRSGVNQTMIHALTDIATKSEQLVSLTRGETVLDIGCNDGTLLAGYETMGIYKVGFDPAKNLTRYANEVADKIVSEYFEADIYNAELDLRNRKPKIITSIAMFYDLDDPTKFVADIKEILHPEGVWVIQMSYLPLMLSQNEVGNICHEHLEYYSLHSLEYLLNMFEFKVVDVELNEINGGSFRVYIRNKDGDDSLFADSTYRALAADRLAAQREYENQIGLSNKAIYEEFAFWAGRIREDLVNFIMNEVDAGKSVYVYGASTKGNTLLQYCNLNSDIITAAAERNPDKWGRLTVGTRIPIISEEEARAQRPAYFLVLPWHFIEEFKMREIAFLKAGGRFIVPMPAFSLI